MTENQIDLIGEIWAAMIRSGHGGKICLSEARGTCSFCTITIALQDMALYPDSEVTIDYHISNVKSLRRKEAKPNGSRGKTTKRVKRTTSKNAGRKTVG